MRPRFLHLLNFVARAISALLLATSLWASESKLVRLDGTRQGKVFEGIGACSAGASSRLLIDYPEPYRTQILDFLFLPKYGAGFQHLKVEIGGDVNSTDGCEPSHMRERNDLNYRRGYEWWLMKQAQHRNPAVKLDCLEWGAPAWIGNENFYSQDNADYIVKFIQGARDVHGLDLKYVGIWNETRADLGWIKRLRRTLNESRLGGVEIVAADDINRWNMVDLIKTDAELARAVQVVGVHYPKFQSSPAAKRCPKPIWSSEDGPWKGNWAGACALAKAYNRNYVEGRMTKTIIWSPVTSYYDNLPLPGSGAMRANSPWSGHYEVQPAVWATAHTTQFAEPGWRYLDDPACGLLPAGGSFVTLKTPQGDDYSIIVETIDATGPQEITWLVEAGLSAVPLHVWRSSSTAQFARQSDLTPANGRFTTLLDPNCIYSLTTTTGQSKGVPASPAAAPFPAPYAETFETYEPGATPKYFSDQAGIFEVAKRAKGKGLCLRQVIERKGIEWHYHLNPQPETFLGNVQWSDYEVSVDVLLEQPGFASLFGRVGLIKQDAGLPSGYWFKLDENGSWELGNATVPLASGDVPCSLNTWHRLKLQFAGSSLKAFVDERLVADIVDSTYASGMVGLGCGWHRAQFDNLEIRTAAHDVNLAFGKPASASSVLDVDSTATAATDANPYGTRWTAAAGKRTGEWLAVDLGAELTFNQVVLRPFEDRITSYKVQVWRGGAWVDAQAGGNLGGNSQAISFPPVQSSQVRLLVLEAKNDPSLWEFEVYHRR